MVSNEKVGENVEGGEARMGLSGLKNESGRKRTVNFIKSAFIKVPSLFSQLSASADLLFGRSTNNTVMWNDQILR